MAKYIDATIIEDTETHYIVELTVETKKLFSKPKQEKVKVFREKRYETWRTLNTGSWIIETIGESLDAFLSTGKTYIQF